MHNAEDAPGGLPVGARVEVGQPFRAPRRAVRGVGVLLRPVEPESDADVLYAPTHDEDRGRAVWTYMACGPFADVAAMRDWLADCARSADTLFCTVVDHASGTCVGVVSFLRMRPEHLTLELGNIWYVPAVQRTGLNTEAVYLMLREAFEHCGCRRVEWKCDALNVRSRAAALRLGFGFEGVFRQHVIVKHRNRDTAWFSMLDHEWPAVRKRLESWLAEPPDRRPSLSAAS